MNLHTKTALDRTLQMTPALQVKLASSDAPAGRVEGYASVFGGPPDSYGDIIAPGAFKRSLTEHKAQGTTPVMLWRHDSGAPIGRWTDLREDANGLWIGGQLNLETAMGRDAYAHLKQGDVSGLSIGFLVGPAGRKENADGTRTLTDIDLVEVSVVALPANRRARVAGVKDLGSRRDLEELLREGGLARAAAAKIAAGGWPALIGANNNDDETFAAAAQAAATRIEKAADRLMKR